MSAVIVPHGCHVAQIGISARSVANGMGNHRFITCPLLFSIARPTMRLSAKYRYRQARLPANYRYRICRHSPEIAISHSSCRRHWPCSAVIPSTVSHRTLASSSTYCGISTGKAPKTATSRSSNRCSIGNCRTWSTSTGSAS